ncbi:MAG: membrane protein insertion efficiency factor YidD [Planctomycetaceae bacterium]|nr:membrane protein insertion efficiency factor YidD [Planctomycetaceae bacterium]
MNRVVADPLILLISGYQKYLSPYIGFCCAHRVVHGGRSCSEQAQSLIRNVGPTAAFRLMQRRFARCRSAAQLLKSGEDRKQLSKKSNTCFDVLDASIFTTDACACACCSL